MSSFRYFDNERAFTRWVLKEARSKGWLAVHMGNVTPFRGGAFPDRNASGFPDVVLVHPVWGLVWAELKMPGRSGLPGPLRPEQVVWLRALIDAGQRVYVWAPAHQQEILDVLDGRPSSVRLFEDVA